MEEIRSKPASKEYRKNYDRIFRGDRPLAKSERTAIQPLEKSKTPAVKPPARGEHSGGPAH